MRVTLNLSTEAMTKLRQLAQQRHATLGEVASELILKAPAPDCAPALRNGVPVFPSHHGTAPNLVLVNRLRDEDTAR